MLSAIKRAVGYVTCETKNGVITVEGVPSYAIQNDITAIWKTSRIQGFMFNHLGKSSFSFNEFFALDIVYAIETLLSQRRIQTSRRVLSNILEHLRTQTWLAQIEQKHPSRLNYDKLKGFHKKPLEKQAEFFETYDQTVQRYSLRGMLLAAAAGSGKTITSLMLSELLQPDCTVVVAPINSIVDVWEKTLCTEFVNKPRYWLSTSGQPVRAGERYYVVHYEALENFVRQSTKLHGRRINIVLDESHNFNSVSSLRTELFLSMCQTLQAHDVLWMSGTPIKALGSEAIPLFRSIDKLFTSDTEFRFKKISGLSSTRGADILQARLGLVSYVVEKKDLPIEDPNILPIKLVSTPNSHEFTLDAVALKMAHFTKERLAYYEKLAPEHKEFYYGVLNKHAATLRSAADKEAYKVFRRQLEEVIDFGGDSRFVGVQMQEVNRYENTKIIPHLSAEDVKKFRDIRSAVKYVLLKVRGECLGRVVAKERMLAHLAMVPYIEFDPIFDSSEKKTVIFTSFVEVLEKLLMQLGAAGHDAVSVYGKTNNLLSATLQRFEKDKNVNPLVATYKSLSTAVPLLMADVVVLIDAPFRDYILQQTISRTSRLGATTQTTVHMFALDTGNQPNITTRSYDILRWSQEQVNAILGVKSPFEVTEDYDKAMIALESIEMLDDQDTGLFDVKERSAQESLTQPVFMNW